MANETPPPQDPKDEGRDLKNLQAEFSRKQQNMDDKLSQINKTNELLLAQIQAMQPAPRKSKEDDADLATMIYDDPNKAVEIMEKRVEQKLEKKYNQVETQKENKNNILRKITSEYPEATDDNHPLTKRALEIFNSYGSSDPVMLQTAVFQAAAEQGIKPKSKRTESEEYEDVASGSSSRGSSRRRREKESDLNQRTKTFAQLMGINTSDPKVEARLKERTKKYEKQIRREEDYE